jgi:hypothetical protein
MTENLNPSNAQELAQIARETGALVLRGPLQYPGPESGDWEVGADVIPDVLYPLKDRQVLLILAAVDGDPVHLCGVCGFVLSAPGEHCSRCALTDEGVAAAIDARRTADKVEEWFRERQEGQAPHPLEAELEKLQTALDALDECPPLWWLDRLLWRGLRWFYRMRQRRVGEALDQGQNHSSNAR